MSIRSFSKALIAALFVLSVAVTSFAKDLPSGVTEVTTVEGITEYRLDNGLRVLLFPDQTKQSVTVNITYLVGSRHENYGETGMAHLLEHLVFKGTPNHPDIPAELTKYGASPNGTTFFDRTNYFETVAANEENLNWALDLESDRMINSYIAKKDLESEFSVVRNELESGENNSFRVTFQKLMAAAYNWHNYGKSTIGARSDIENVPIDRLKGFYKKYYQPDNAVLLVAGKFDPAKTLNTINEKFGAIPKPERKLPKIYTVEPVQDGEKLVTIRRVGDEQRVMAGYHVAPDTHPDTGAVDVMSNIIANSPSGRLYKSLVETKKAVNVTSLDIQFKDPGYLIYGATVKKDGDLADASKTLIETIETFADNPPTKEEVERAKTQILKGFELTLNDPNRVGLGMSEYIAQGDWRYFFITRDRVKKVTPADVQRVAKKYLKRSNRTVARFIPTQEPDRAEVPVVSDEEVAKTASAYKGGEAVAAGEAFDPSPANIESRTTRSTIGGIKVAFLPKENRGDTVFANLSFSFGDEKSLMNRGTAASLAGALLNRGTATKSRQQIKDEFDRLKANVRVSGGATGATVSIESTRKNLPAVMKLVAEILKTASFPKSEFEQLKAQRLNGLEQQRSNPQGVALREMSKHFNVYPKGHFRYAGTLDENIADLNAVTIDQVRAFHKDFYGASNGELAVVGDFDPEEISSLVSDLFAGWKSPKGYTRVPNEYADIKPVNMKFETPDKANAFFLARLNLKLRDDNPDYPAMRVANNIIGGGFLNSRLASRIRQKEGLSYGVGSQMQISSRYEQGAFLAFAIYAPQNLEKLEDAFNEEIAKVLNEGFTEAEVEAAVKGMVLAAKRQRASDATIAARLRNYLDLDRKFAWDADYEKKLESVTVDQVNAAIKRYLTQEKISIFKAGDFAKSAAAAQ
ncbi:MAG: insulinase family protein [Pyrinomonadaceae bacterium]|nr:insulinase family protein [Pyrinomonadaceae bacterium]